MPHATLVDEPISLDRTLDQGPDQRQAERRQISHPAIVSVVGTPGQVLHGVIRNVSEGGTQIRLDETLAPSTLVKIEYDDNLLLGEVVYCREEQSAWLVGVKIEHGLFELRALATAMQGF
jgi:PilZ domain-containing protein